MRVRMPQEVPNLITYATGSADSERAHVRRACVVEYLDQFVHHDRAGCDADTVLEGERIELTRVN